MRSAIGLQSLSRSISAEPMALKIQRALFEQMRQHAERAYPLECCGVLVGLFNSGTDRTVERVAPCVNASIESLHKRYEISAVDLLRTQREARFAGQQIVGFYHSHPDHPARWSTTDLDQAHWTGCSYVIISVDKGRAGAANSFLLMNEGQSRRFQDEFIEFTGE